MVDSSDAGVNLHPGNDDDDELQEILDNNIRSVIKEREMNKNKKNVSVDIPKVSLLLAAIRSYCHVHHSRPSHGMMSMAEKAL
jgi:hypothetical protein